MTRSARFLLPMIRKAIAHLPGAALQHRIVAVDLTPWPGAAPNGVSAAAACDWVRALAEVQPHWRWILLTTPAIHDNLGHAEAYNVRRHCTRPAHAEAKIPDAMRYGTGNPLRKACRLLLRMVGLPRPPAVLPTDTLVRGLEADLLFCPLGTTNFHDATVPTVALWPDLAGVEYPQFLPPDERSTCERLFKEAVRIADSLVCFSPATQDRIVDKGKAEESRVIALAPRPLRRLPHPPAAAVARILDVHGLSAGGYILCPGEVSEPANHKLLLVALGMHRSAQPRSALRLVCDGRGPCYEELQSAAARMGLADNVHWVAALTADEEAALLAGCRAVFWPGLAEGGSHALLHALEFGKPILCSDLDCLPEPARAAAFLVDPRKPTALVQALELAGTDAALAPLAHRSRQQAHHLGSPRDAAEGLARVFQDAISGSRRFADALRDLHCDGWTGERLVVAFARADAPRKLRLHLRAACWLPWGHQKVRLLKARGKPGKVFHLKRGHELVIETNLPAEGGCLEFLIDPPVRPSALGLNTDDRTLGCECLGCTITGPAGTLVLHPPAAA